MDKKAQVGLIQLDGTNLPKWLLYPLVILVCLTLLTVILFFGVVGYSCVKGDCNAYYGMRWFGFHSPPIVVTQFNSHECYSNGIPINCSEVKSNG